jgi:hypothetical protein
MGAQWAEVSRRRCLGRSLGRCLSHGTLGRGGSVRKEGSSRRAAAVGAGPAAPEAEANLLGVGADAVYHQLLPPLA